MMIPDSEKFITEAVEKYSDTVFRVAFQYTGNRCDSEDIVQDVFVKLLDKRPPLVGEPLKAWLIRVTINRSKDVLRALARRRKAPLGYALPAPQPELYEEVFDALAQLPERDRTALYLHYYEGYTAREIAGMIGGSERAATKRICRAREKMKKYLSEE